MHRLISPSDTTNKFHRHICPKLPSYTSKPPQFPTLFIKYCASSRSVAVSSTSITTGFHSSHFTPSSNRSNCVCSDCSVCIAFSSLFSAFSSPSSIVGVDSQSNPWDPTLLPPSLAYNACRLRCGTCENARRATSTPKSWPRTGEIAAGPSLSASAAADSAGPSVVLS